jgi:hypothetical protein
MSLVVAHAGHWLEGLAFGLPVVATPGALALWVLRERRRERRDGLVRPG